MEGGKKQSLCHPFLFFHDDIGFAKIIKKKFCFSDPPKTASLTLRRKYPLTSDTSTQVAPERRLVPPTAHPPPPHASEGGWVCRGGGQAVGGLGGWVGYNNI